MVKDRAFSPPTNLAAREWSEDGLRFVLFEWSDSPSEPARERTDSLTEAERAVAELAVRGLSNAEIAESRGSSTRTVANQLAAIFRKLGLQSRAELTAHWFQSDGAH